MIIEKCSKYLMEILVIVFVNPCLNIFKIKIHKMLVDKQLIDK
jgi:hypothetical protein